MYSGAMGKMIAGILIKTQNEDSPLRVSHLLVFLYQILTSLLDNVSTVFHIYLPTGSVSFVFFGFNK